jgi:hypothetical protein
VVDLIISLFSSDNYMLSIGLVSYNAPKTLQNTLATYKESGLLKYSDDIFCVVQFSGKQLEEIDICHLFGIKYYILTENVGISGGLLYIYKLAKYEHVLFLENDFINLNNEVYTKKQLDFVMKNKDDYDYFKLRSRKNSGDPNYSVMCISPGEELEWKNIIYLADCIYWIENPDEKFGEYIKKISDDPKYYCCSSNYCNYSNNPFICSKDFFKNNILPFVTFNRTLELEIQTNWENKNYKCCFGDGIFTHVRFDGKN